MSRIPLWNLPVNSVRFFVKDDSFLPERSLDLYCPDNCTGLLELARVTLSSVWLNRCVRKWSPCSQSPDFQSYFGDDVRITEQARIHNANRLSVILFNVKSNGFSDMFLCQAFKIWHKRCGQVLLSFPVNHIIECFLLRVRSLIIGSIPGIPQQPPIKDQIYVLRKASYSVIPLG